MSKKYVKTMIYAFLRPTCKTRKSDSKTPNKIVKKDKKW